MPKKSDTERVTFYIPRKVKEQLDEYVSQNYSVANAYGAYSNVATQALSCFCSNAGTKTTCLDTSLLNLVAIDSDTYESTPINDCAEVKKEDV
jgi:hypothetical protein